MAFEARTRWSQVARGCARMGAMALRGSEPEEPDDILQGYFARGKDCENHVYQRFEAQYGPEDLIRHKAVPWPAGIAHGDIFVRSIGLPVEVKSMADPRPIEGHIVQLAGQVVFDPDAHGEGLLVLVNPINYQLNHVPVIVNERLERRVEQLVAAVTAAADRTTPLPERVCQRPSDSRQYGCPFVGECFADWVAPEPETLADDVAALAGQLVRIDGSRKAIAEQLSGLEEERNRIRELIRHTLEPRRLYMSDDGTVEVKITPVAPRTTFSIKAARDTGIWTDDDEKRFGHLVSIGKGHDRWTVRAPIAESDSHIRLADLIDDDSDPFGTDAPWTAEDLKGFAA